MLAGCADGGDAVSLLQVSAARVEVGKNGLTADGRIPSIEVESDGYWRVFAESSAAWVRTDPSAASGSCTVTLSVEANDGPARRPSSSEKSGLAYNASFSFIVSHSG